MKLKYKNKTYNSEDIPLFLYFKTANHKKDFTTLLVSYKVGNYKEISNIHGILAGNTVIKDKRSKITFCIESAEEKRIIIKGMYNDSNTDNNAMVCSPGDIPEHSLVAWIEKNIEKIM